MNGDKLPLFYKHFVVGNKLRWQDVVKLKRGRRRDDDDSSAASGAAPTKRAKKNKKKTADKWSRIGKKETDVFVRDNMFRAEFKQKLADIEAIDEARGNFLREAVAAILFWTSESISDTEKKNSKCRKKIQNSKCKKFQM